MNVRVEIVCLGADGSEQRRDVLVIERRHLAMETLGMNLGVRGAAEQRTGLRLENGLPRTQNQ